MKIFTLVIVLLAISYTRAIPTWGASLPPSRGPGWSDNAAIAAGLYPNYAYPYAAGYGYVGSAPVYTGSYAQSPSFPGYTPGLYGLGYLNLRH